MMGQSDCTSIRITQRDKRNPVVEGFVFESDLYLLANLRCKPAVVPNDRRKIIISYSDTTTLLYQRNDLYPVSYFVPDVRITE